MTERRRYHETHWSRIEDPEVALANYLKMYSDNYNHSKAEIYRRMLGDVTGKRILDYGGGAGYMTVMLAVAGAEVVLVDAEDNALKTALHYAGKQGVASRVSTIRSVTVPTELKDEKFDIVISKDVIEHVEDDGSFIKDLYECLKPGGLLFISTQNSHSLNYLIEGTAYRLFRPQVKWMGWDRTHLRFYTPSSLRALIEDRGFIAERVASAYIIPYKILSLFTAGRCKFEFGFLKHFDYAFGSKRPFCNWGWNIIIQSRKME